MNPNHWRFVVPTALGRTTSSIEFTETELRFESDDVMGGSATLRWDSVGQACTAAMPGIGGPGAPDFPEWLPDKVEWVLLSRTAGGGEPLMRTLPQGADRDAIVNALRQRLGARWIGERLPLKDAHARLGIVANAWGTWKVVGIVVAVLALLALLIVLMALLLHPVIAVPAGTVLGAWLVRKGRNGLRQVDIAAGMVTRKIAGAPIGPVALQGRVVTPADTVAGISGRACIWWDVTVWAWSEDSDRQVEWNQIASRHGGAIDLIEIDDGSGRLPVWLNEAQLMLETRTWDSGSSALPAEGRAFMASLGFGWGSGSRLKVTETGLEANAPLYVLGTLDERRHVALPPPPTGLDRVAEMLRSGEWRQALVRAVPAPGRIVVAVLIGYVDMMVSLGSGRDRVRHARDAVVPDLAPTDRLVWLGRTGAPFVVSDRPGNNPLAAWRSRSKWTLGIGIGAWCFTLYMLVEYLGG